MENFIVSARKYRPATFDTVVGQTTITRTLKNAIRTGQLAQAFLFCGPRGVGKTTCARILAKTINCLNITENIEACNVCESCKSFNSSASFNIHELDAASNNSVEDIRNLVDQVRIPPQLGRYKVYIIDEVHMLSASAFNAFLKTLEEPPAYAKFILATTEKHKIIPTILSRCQIFDFKRISVDDIAGHLKYVSANEKVNASEDALHIIAQKADGAMRDALSIFDQLVSFSGNEISYQQVIQNLNVLDYDYYFRLIAFILKGDAANTLLIINEIIDNGFDGQYFITGLGEHLRNLLVCKDTETAGLLEVSENLKKRYLQQSELCETTFLLRSLSINYQYDSQYKTSSNKRLLLELSALQMCGLMGYPRDKKDENKKKPVLPDPGAGAGPAKPPKSDYPDEKEKKESVAEEPAVKKDVKKETVPDPILDQYSIKKTSEKLNGRHDKKTEATIASKNKSPFSEADLHSCWAACIAEVCKHSENLRSSLTDSMPVLRENFEVEVTAYNKVIEKEIRDLLPKMLAYLRKDLNNDLITAGIRVADPGEQENKAYFPDEIYKKMAEKNPEITNLRNQLGLDIDF
jgi:DNA polymerase III subunit gamma/tau